MSTYYCSPILPQPNEKLKAIGFIITFSLWNIFQFKNISNLWEYFHESEWNIVCNMAVRVYYEFMEKRTKLYLLFLTIFKYMNVEMHIN